MEVNLNPRLTYEVRNSAHMAGLLAQAAAAYAAGIAAATPADTGETRASTRVESGHRTADNKSVAAWVVQGGAAVQQQFGNSRENTPARQFDRGARG